MNRVTRGVHSADGGAKGERLHTTAEACRYGHSPLVRHSVNEEREHENTWSTRHATWPRGMATRGREIGIGFVVANDDDMDPLTTLRAFVTTARLQSFNKAARTLGVSCFVFRVARYRVPSRIWRLAYRRDCYTGQRAPLHSPKMPGITFTAAFGFSMNWTRRIAGLRTNDAPMRGSCGGACIR
jgi:hypothetical protein